MNAPTGEPLSSASLAPTVRHTSHLRLFAIFVLGLAVAIAAVLGVRALVVKPVHHRVCPQDCRHSSDRTTRRDRPGCRARAAGAHRGAKSAARVSRGLRRQRPSQLGPARSNGGSGRSTGNSGRDTGPLLASFSSEGRKLLLRLP